MELEDIIRRKNMIINKLRKDIVTLEQKVMIHEFSLLGKRICLMFVFTNRA